MKENAKQGQVNGWENYSSDIMLAKALHSNDLHKASPRSIGTIKPMMVK